MSGSTNTPGRRQTRSASPSPHSIHHNPAPLFPIQRLLLVHWNLAELSIGKSLSDGASEAELAQEILYYHDSSAGSSYMASGSSSSAIHAEQLHALNHDALSFAGICKALYVLPQTIHEASGAGSREVTDDDADADAVENHDNDNVDRTQHVHLGNSCLSFVALEEEAPEIVAVAQTERAFGATPSAVRAAIHRSHQQFCLLRGGGIHRRLLQATAGGDNNPTNEENNKQTYPGMEQLYKLRKQQGQLEEEYQQQRLRAQRGGGTSNKVAAAAAVDGQKDAALPTKQQQKQDRLLLLLHDQIQSLYAQLPVASLRRDLRVHYDAFLTELSQQAAVSNRCVLRSLVQQVPSPVPRLDGSHAIHESSLPDHGHSVDSDDDGGDNERPSTRQLLESFGDFLASGSSFGRTSSSTTSTSARDGERGAILGISTFLGSSLIATQAAVAEGFQVPDDTAALLFRYMSSFRYHHSSSSAHTSQSSSRSSTPTRKRGLPQIMFSFGDRPDVDMMLSSETAAQTHHDRGFLGPPSLSLLSTLDEIRTLDGPYEGMRVWALPISLSLAEAPGADETKKEKSQRQRNYQDAIVSMYFSGDYSFLLYLSPLASSQEVTVNDSGRYVGIFQRFLRTLPFPLDEGRDFPSAAQSSLVNGIHRSIDHHQPKWHGCQIIFIDRKRHSLYLHGADGSSPSSGDSTDRSKRISSRSSSKLGTSDLLSYGLDCRHLLASRLSLDTVLALEGAMEEVRFHTSSHSPTTAFEACTSLSNRWVYAHAVNNQELYVLFDATKFVTITDVQRQAVDIRNELSAACVRC